MRNALAQEWKPAATTMCLFMRRVMKAPARRDDRRPRVVVGACWMRCSFPAMSLWLLLTVLLIVPLLLLLWSTVPLTVLLLSWPKNVL